MAELVFEAEERAATGKNANRALRRTGRVPAVYYLAREENVLLSLDSRNLVTRLAHASGVVTVKTPSRELRGLVRELQVDPVTGAPLHVDFMGVDLNKPVTATVEIILVGTAVGVKSKGGIIDHRLRALEIECLPLDIPANVPVDVSALDIGHSIRVADVRVEKVRILTPGTHAIVSVVPPTVEKAKPVVEEVAAVEGEAAPAEGAAPETAKADSDE